jgi:hypothetical protein
LCSAPTRRLVATQDAEFLFAARCEVLTTVEGNTQIK